MAPKKAPRHLRKKAEGKILAQELLVDEAWAFVTVHMFAVVEPTGEIRVQRPWHEVATGEWDDARHVLSITWVDGSRPTRIKTAHDAPITFPKLFKERVDASVVYSETLPVAGGVLRGALRRTPSGELISQISSDKKLPSNPVLDQQVTQLEQKLWEFIGI